MNNWKPLLLVVIALYFYYNLFVSIKKGRIIWKIFTFDKNTKALSFWLACVSQFLLATIFLGFGIALMFFYDQILGFLVSIS